MTFKKGMISLNKGKTKEKGLYPAQCGFQKGHLPYGGITKGRLKGNIPWNKGTSLWVDCICKNCGKGFKIRKSQFERGRGKYCSKSCKTKSTIAGWNKAILKTKWCLYCSKSFEVRPCEESRKFCSKDCANKYRKNKKIASFSEEHKKKIGETNKLVSHPFGKDHPRWKGGITPFYNILRTLEEYNKWRMDCLRRDWFKCKICDSKKHLEVHHKKSFKKLVNEFLQQYNQFSIIDDRETLTRLAMTYVPFWDIDNGETLCAKCHKSLRRETTI